MRIRDPTGQTGADEPTNAKRRSIMTMSVKDLNAVAAQAKEMADRLKSAAEAAAGMAAAVQVIVDDCAEQLKEQRNAVSDTDKVTETAVPATVKPVESPARKLTLVELRAFVADHSNPTNRPKIKELLNSFGVSKLTELPEEHYAELMEGVSKL